VVLDDVGTVLRHLVPVNDIPPAANILGAAIKKRSKSAMCLKVKRRKKRSEENVPAILVFEVVGMLPNIQSKDWEHDLVLDTLHERVILVGGVDNLKLVTLLVHTHPNPATSKGSSWSGHGLKLLFHGIHGSKRLVDHLRQLSRSLGILRLVSGKHLFPEEGVVVVASSTVADTRSGFQSIGHEVKDGDLGLAFTGLVDVGNVGTMMFVVVNLHGRSINVRLKALEGVRKIRNKVGVSSSRGGKYDSSCKGLSEGSTTIDAGF
jgi:hypothetical protein